MIGTFIKRPVFTTMFVLLLVVFGIRCYPEIGVDWGITDPILSVKDQTAPVLADSDCNFVYKGE